MHLRIGTRKSELALWQARWVQDRLSVKGISSELITIETIGDKKLETTIAKIGSKGVFTDELESLLRAEEIHIAVHSAKDMASTLPDGFKILAFGPRESASDVLVSLSPISIQNPLVVGTSSTRRIAQLSKYFPHFKLVPVRGNLQTRIRKMEEGNCDALLLAKAGVIRMEYAHLIRHEFSLDQLVPAASQGSIAIECLESLPRDIQAMIRKATNDETAEIAIATERDFLRAMEGGCSIPVYAHAILEADNKIHLTGGLLSLDGQQEIKREIRGKATDRIGSELGRRVLQDGGQLLLNEIKKQLQ